MKIKTALFSFFIISRLFAQNVTIVNGSVYKPAKSDGVYETILDYNDQYMYVKRLSTKGSGFTQVIQKVDRKNFNIIYTSDYKFDESKRDLVNETELETVVAGDKIYVFTRVFNLSESKVFLLLRTFDANNGQEIGQQQEAMNIPCTKQEAPDITFYIIFSENKTKAILGSNVSKDFMVYDTKNFSRIGSKSLYFKKDATYNAFTLDNSGNLMYLISDNANLSFVSIETNQNNPNIVLLKENLGKVKSSEIKVTGNQAYISGITSGNKLFYVRYDLNSKTVLNASEKLMSSDIEQKISDYKEGIGYDRYISFNQTIINKDYIYLIASHSYVSVVTYNSVTKRYPVENELIISKFKITGEFEWMKMVPKFNYQKTAGHNIIEHNDNLFVFYLEHPKNLKSDIENYDKKSYPGISTSGVGGCQFVCTTINSNGKMSRKALFRNDDWYYMPINKNITDKNERSLVIMMFKGDHQRYDRIIVD